jgi:hypothetical protein
MDIRAQEHAVRWRVLSTGRECLDVSGPMRLSGRTGLIGDGNE